MSGELPQLAKEVQPLLDNSTLWCQREGGGGGGGGGAFFFCFLFFFFGVLVGFS